MSWTGWCYSSDWGPAMLTSVNPEVKNPSGNLMYKAFHDTVPVISAVGVKNPAAAPVSQKNISISNSSIRFYCSEASQVTLSLYALDGRLVSEAAGQMLTKGSHSVRLNGADNSGTSVAPGLYVVRLKIMDREYHALVNMAR